MIIPSTQSSPSAPLIVVFGATGHQGGSVFNHLESSPHPYRVRALTRSVDSPAAKDLQRRGADLHCLWLAPAKPPDVKKALEGADMVWAVLTYGPEAVNDSLIIAEAAKEAGIKLFLWSSLPSYADISHGELPNVMEFEAKRPILRALKECQIPYVDVQVGAYSDNYVTGAYAPERHEDGSYIFQLPIKGDAPIAYIDTARDLGAFVVGAIEMPEERRPKVVRAATEDVTFEQAARTLSEATGNTIRFKTVTPEEYRTYLLGLDTAPEEVQGLIEMWQAMEKYTYWDKEKATPREALGIKAPFTTFEEFAKKQDWTGILTK